MRNKLISLMTAISLVMPLTAAFAAFIPAAVGYAATVSSPAPDHEIRVVGKRITGDNKYFEISLEVDRDYEEYTSVGVVLEYDPSVIVPAASWDDAAAEADMTENVSWATRRALPTLGKDTWTTHTALAYQTQKADPSDATGTKMIPDKGYLYLGAEYPGTVPDPYDPSVTPDPSASPTATPTPTPAPTDTPDPNVTPDPDIYVNPIVVARFMYVGADDSARAITKQTKLEAVWTTPAPVPDGTSWDENWLGTGTTAATAQNTILHIAPDDISAYSTAEYGASIYYCDFSRKVYRYAYPAAPAATATPTPDPSATATPQPFATYSPAPVGSAVDASEKLDASDIEIVLGEGKSAKSGGLTLDDVCTIMFFDWDDTVIGSLTAAKGADMRPSVEEYVKQELMHPELATKDYGNMNSSNTDTVNSFLMRTNSYRGKYPHDLTTTITTAPYGAYGANTVTDGAQYPLSNKLDYVIAGIDLDKDYPRANCWTLVTPENMSDTWTALEYKNKTTKVLKDHTFEKVDKATGYAFDSTGNPDPTAVMPSLVSYDFSSIPDADLNGGVLYVKAVYRPGKLLDLNATAYEQTAIDYTLLGNTINANVATYGITFTYERINNKGQGVKRARRPQMKVEATMQTAVTQGAPTVAQKLYLSPDGQWIDNYNGVEGEYIEVTLPSNRFLYQIGYTLYETYGNDIIMGTAISAAMTAATKALFYDKWDGTNNYIKQKCALGRVVELLSEGLQGNINVTMLQDAGIKQANGTQITTYGTTQKNLFKNTTIPAAKTAQGTDTPVFNFYMVQYALLNNGAYVAPDAAQAACLAKGYSWCN